MIIGIGIDIADIGRVRGAIERSGGRFLRKIFTDAELASCRGKREPFQHLAARFAAKEAAMKALSTGWSSGISWKDIEVVATASGAPQLNLTGEAERLFKNLGGKKVHLSLSHQRDLASASVIIEG